MEDNTRKLPVRFNLNKPDQKKAWEYLQTMNRNEFASWNHVIHLALLDYFDRYYKVQEDPYLETREREEIFIQQIVDGVCESLKQTLPMFLAGCMTCLSALQPASAPVASPLQAETPPAEESADPEPESIDWGFLGS
jgi:hypothetical protein